MSLSSDGEWLAVGAPGDYDGIGATIVYPRPSSSLSFVAFGVKLVGQALKGESSQGKIEGLSLPSALT